MYFHTKQLLLIALISAYFSGCDTHYRSPVQKLGQELLSLMKSENYSSFEQVFFSSTSHADFAKHRHKAQTNNFEDDLPSLQCMDTFIMIEAVNNVHFAIDLELAKKRIQTLKSDLIACFMKSKKFCSDEESLQSCSTRRTDTSKELTKTFSEGLEQYTLRYEQKKRDEIASLLKVINKIKTRDISLEDLTLNYAIPEISYIKDLNKGVYFTVTFRFTHVKEMTDQQKSKLDKDEPRFAKHTHFDLKTKCISTGSDIKIIEIKDLDRSSETRLVEN